MKKILLPGLVAGIAVVLASMFIMWLSNAFFPGLIVEYKNGMFRPWTDPLMEIFFFGPIVSGFILSAIWNTVKGVVPECKFGGGKAVRFSLMYWFVSVVGLFMTYSTFKISFLMVFSWGVSALVQALVAGLVLSKMNK